MIFNKSAWHKPLVWIFALGLLVVAVMLPKLAKGSHNNYLIYKHVFWHVWQQEPLYTTYPDLYFDKNHYGPLFSLIIAPFALLPDVLGMLLWSVVLYAIYIYAIWQLPFSDRKKTWIILLCFNEYLISAQSFQINGLMVALIILTYVHIQKGREWWAAAWIMLGTFIKLYGIVGLAFFFFVKNKPKFVAALLFWALLFWIAPMCISSLDYINQRYIEWWVELGKKNEENAQLNSYQDISVMGVFRRFTQNPAWPNWPFIGMGLLVFGSPYLRFSLYRKPLFQWLLLSAVLLFTVIFSTGSESPTYIIAFVGLSIWYVTLPTPRQVWQHGLLIAALLITSMSHTDLCPKFLLYDYVRPYALKAVPCILIWMAVSARLLDPKLSSYADADAAE